MDDYHGGWPEPVVRVQSISESGVQSIPSRYIKPPSERPGSAGVNVQASELRMPVIDLALADDFDVAAKAVSDACREWGFFQVVNHGVNPELMRRMRETWREFFHLPMEEKQRYANSPVTFEGYGSRLGVQKGAILDWGDYYYLHYLPLCLKDHNKWPRLPDSLRETTELYGVEVIKLCERLMKAMSAGLGLDAGRLPEAFGDVGVCMRVNYYPKCPQPDLTLGLSSHSDPGGMTLLLADDCVDGLQVRKNGAWINARPLPDAFIVNVGDQIQVLSNAVYKSVEHRVRADAGKERLSMAFFYNPRADMPIGPMPEFVTADRPTKYQTMTFNEYRLFIRMKGPRGKSHVDSINLCDASKGAAN